jgi:hypothetical protein
VIEMRLDGHARNSTLDQILRWVRNNPVTVTALFGVVTPRRPAFRYENPFSGGFP